MGFLSKLTKSALSVVVLPLDIVKDIVTIGGALDDSEPATTKRLGKAADALNESLEDLGDGDIL